MRRRFLVGTFGAIVGLVLVMGYCLAQEGEFVGKQAIEIEVEEWINAPKETNLSALRGRIVFLEFWATW